MEKTSTRMPQSLATAKWPNSWTRTMMPRTMRSSITVDMKLGKTSLPYGGFATVVPRRPGWQSLRAHPHAGQDLLRVLRGQTPGVDRMLAAALSLLYVECPEMGYPPQ